MWPFSSSAAPATAPATCPVERPSIPLDKAQLSPEREISSIPRWLPSTPSAAPSDPSACPARSATPALPPSACPAATPADLANPASPPPATPSEENWVYPSPLSFFSALERKERNPQAPDMPIVVPIHNAVNERVWEQVLQWEKEAGATGTRLVNFVGRPKEPSPRARWMSFIGYSAPFDRHDWIVDRPLPPSNPVVQGEPTSLRLRYIIDFYTGRLPPLHPASTTTLPSSASSSDSTNETPGERGREDAFRPNLAFYLDVRPAVDGFEGGRMRAERFWRKWIGEGFVEKETKMKG